MLGFDFGARRIGVAVGSRELGLAHPLTTIDAEARQTRFEAIATLVAEWRPERLVVGRPLHADGSEHAMTARADRFARQLAGRFGLPVAAVDERFTTQAALAALAQGHARGDARRRGRDAIAAQLILQDYLDRLPTGGDT